MPHMLSYTVKPDQLHEHEQQLTQLSDQLTRAAPAGLRYEIFRLPDGLSFMHLIGHEKAAHGPLTPPPALRAFHAGPRERCQSPPQRTELQPAGSYPPSP